MNNTPSYRNTLRTLIDRLCGRFNHINNEEILEVYKDSVSELELNENDYSSMVQNLGTEVQFIETYLNEREIVVPDNWPTDYLRRAQLTALGLMFCVIIIPIGYIIPELALLYVVGFVGIAVGIRGFVYYRSMSLNKSVLEYFKFYYIFIGILASILVIAAVLSVIAYIISLL